MGFFKRRGFSILKIILFVVIAGISIYLLLRGLINHNIIN